MFDPGSIFAEARHVQPPIMGAMPKWSRVLIARANAMTPVPGFSPRDMIVTWERCEGRCAVSGLPFSLAEIGHGRARRPFAPSLDRIDPALGYTPENLRLVCVAANFGMNAWGQEVYLHVARGAVAKADANAHDGDRAWDARQDAKIRAAEREALLLSGHALKKQVQRIAALKRARTLGPAGLQRAARLAASSRGVRAAS